MAVQFRFGDFVLDLAARELRRGGEVLPLQPKVFAVLALLVRRPGEALSRDDFLEQVWTGRFVTENVLSRCVRQLRILLDDDAAEPRFIRTLRGHGYQFVARVEEVGDGDRAATRTRIAVLPLRPVLPEAAVPALEMGITDTLVNDLSRFEGLVVRPLPAVLDALRGESSTNVQALGERLAVDVVLEGSLQVDDDALRLNLRALRVEDGSALMAERFDAPLAGLFQMQDELCAEVLRRFLHRLSGDEERASQRRRARDLRAYRAYVDGRLKLSLHRVDSIEAALADFERATTYDPDYVEALVGIAEANDSLSTLGTAPVRYHEAARAAAQRALQLDPDRARAHACLGKVAWQYDWDWAGAERHLTRATRLDPDDADAYIALSDFLCHMGRFDEALEAAEQAGAINPFSPWIQALIAQALLLGGRSEEALQQAQQAIRLAPDFGFAYFFLGRALLSLGQEEAAIEAVETAVATTGRPDFQGALAWTLAICGQRERAEKTLAELEAAAAAGAPVPPVAFAIAHAGLGNEARAFEQFQQVARDRGWHILLLHVDPAFEKMRARPEGQALLRQLALPSP